MRLVNILFRTNFMVIHLMLACLIVESCGEKQNKFSKSEEKTTSENKADNHSIHDTTTSELVEKDQNMSEHDLSKHDMGEHAMSQHKASGHTMDKPDKHDVHNRSAVSANSIFNDSLKINSIIAPTNFRVISSQQAIKLSRNTSSNKISARGYIDIDERRNVKVSARFPGRIEKLFIKYNLQYVRKGERIMEIYSPELSTFQEELLYLLKNKDTRSLVNSAKQKLYLLGLTEGQVHTIEKTGKIYSTIEIYSPKDGYIFFKPSSNGVATSTKSGESMNGMFNSSPKVTASEYGQLREGSYVNKGDVLFWMNDLREVWAFLSVDNSHERELTGGATVLLRSELYPNDTINATVNFIEPAYQRNQKFIMSRVYLSNSAQKYKINSLVEAEIIPRYNASSISVPYSSVLFLGKRKIVWVLKEKIDDNSKIFEARNVTIGLIHNGMVEIKSGLAVTDEIALNAAYLIDRESLIKSE